MDLKEKLHASPTRSPSRRSWACRGLSCGSWATAATDASQSTNAHQRMTASCRRVLRFPFTRAAVLLRSTFVPRPALGRFIGDGSNLDDSLGLPRPSDALCRCVVVRGVNRFRDRTDVARRLTFSLNGVAEDSAVVAWRQALLRFPQMLHLRQQQRRHRPLRVSHALRLGEINDSHLATPLYSPHLEIRAIVAHHIQREQIVRRIPLSVIRFDKNVAVSLAHRNVRIAAEKKFRNRRRNRSMIEHTVDHGSLPNPRGNQYGGTPTTTTRDIHAYHRPKA